MINNKQNYKSKNKNYLDDFLKSLDVDKDFLISAIIIKDRLILKFVDGHIATFKINKGVNSV